MKLTVQGREAYAYTGGKPFDPALPMLSLAALVLVQIVGAFVEGMREHRQQAMQRREVVVLDRGLERSPLPYPPEGGVCTGRQEP